MSRFDDAMVWILRAEGGYSNQDGDHGGSTACGVTQESFNEYRKSLGLAPLAVRYITMTDVCSIYLTRYWRPCHCDSLPAPLDLAVFDMAVNSGNRRAILFLQRALGVEDDGLIGPGTIDAVQADQKADLLGHVVQDFMDAREKYYHDIVANDPSQAKFLGGWLNRMKNLREECDK